MQNAPIAIFIFNRPDHTRQMLNSLKKNPELASSKIYVFADGPKSTFSDFQKEKVTQTRKVILEELKNFQVELHYRDKNRGLSKNIISGIDHVLSQHETIIVLEDDLNVSSHFLSYMNKALTHFALNPKVFHVSGYIVPLQEKEKLPETFFLQQATCWGWGTWKRAWKKLNTDAYELKREICKSWQSYLKFDLDGYGDFVSQLDFNIANIKTTWAIKWYGTIFSHDGLSLHPSHSFVNNIGHDGSGVNSERTQVFHWNELNHKELHFPVNSIVHEKAFEQTVAFYKELAKDHNQVRKKVMRYLRRHCPQIILNQILKLKD